MNFPQPALGDQEELLGYAFSSLRNAHGMRLGCKPSQVWATAGHGMCGIVFGCKPRQIWPVCCFADCGLRRVVRCNATANAVLLRPLGYLILANGKLNFDTRIRTNGLRRVFTVALCFLGWPAVHVKKQLAIWPFGTAGSSAKVWFSIR